MKTNKEIIHDYYVELDEVERNILFYTTKRDVIISILRKLEGLED